jgi:hypothetical protein
MLNLLAEGSLRPFEAFKSKNRDVNRTKIPLIQLRILINDRSEQDRIRRKRVPATKADGIPFFRISFTREKIISKKSLYKVAGFPIPVSIFSLNARFRRELKLKKSVRDIVLLISIFSPPVGLKAGPANAEGEFFVYAGENAFTRVRAIFADQRTPLKCNPISIEDGIELIEGE